MRIKVGPARRSGNTKTIYDEPVTKAAITVEEAGTVQLSFDALGIRCDKSLYRYRLKLSRDDITKIVDAARHAGMAMGAVVVQALQQISAGAPLIA